MASKNQKLDIDPRILGNIVDPVSALTHKHMSSKSIPEIIEEFRKALQSAEKEKKKTSMFHSLILLYASELGKISPYEFCERVGLNKAYHIEFRKMIAAANRLAELGYCLKKVV